jgi:phosphoglycolate phosphatase
MIEKYNHIIWDWNGTIFDDLELSYDIINKMLPKYGLKEFSLKQYREYFTIPVRDYYEKAGFDFSKESFEIVGREWMDEYERRKFECGLSEGVLEIMEKIKSLNIEQSILSAYSQHTLDEMIDHYDIRKYLKYVAGLDNIYAASKLDQGKMLIEKIGAEKGKVLLIGDTIHDLEVATEIGADCVLLSSGHQCIENLERLSKPFGSIPIIPSIDKLLS